jgi:hypothetical protein
MFEICRKDLLARNLNRMLKIFPDDYNIFPKTWCFPAEYVLILSNLTFLIRIISFLFTLKVSVTRFSGAVSGGIRLSLLNQIKALKAKEFG